MMNHQECLSWWSSNGKAAKSAILRHADLGKGKDGKLRFKSIEAYLPEGTRRFLSSMKFTTSGLHEQLQARIYCDLCKLPCVKNQGICYHCIHSPAGKALRSAALSVQFKSQWASASTEDRKTRIAKRKATSKARYGADHPMKAQSVKDTLRAAIQARYGVDAPMQSLEVQATLRRNLKRKHGVVNVSQLDEVKRKKQETCLKNHGVPHPQQSPEVRAKAISTLKKNFGVNHQMRSPIVRKKVASTCLDKYGVAYPQQNEEVFLRAQASGLKTRTVINPDTGEVYALRGYEPYAYPLLYGLYGSHLRPSPKGSNLWYTLKGRTRRFYPDFAVDRKDGTSMFFEVKSLWTLENELNINRKKAASGDVRFLVIAPYPKKGFVRYLLLPQGWERMKVRDLNKLLVPTKFKSFPLT